MSSSNSALVALTRQLVDRLAPALDESSKSYATDYCLREVQDDVKGGTRREWVDVVTALARAERSARVRVQDELADGLQQCARELDTRRRKGQGWEGDMPVKMSNLPQHMQLLLNLSSAPSSSTHAYARTYLNRSAKTGPTSDQLLYQQIMDEPFSGDHWGAGYDEEVHEGWTDSSGSDGGDLSSEDEPERIVTPLTERAFSRKDIAKRELEDKVRAAEERLRLAEESLRTLQEGYWRTGGKELEAMREGLSGWREIMTQTSAASLVAQISGIKVKVISARELQREILFALTGRSGVIFTLSAEGICTVLPDPPQVKQFSPLALGGIFQTFSGWATQLMQNRHFIANTLSPAQTSSAARSKTKEAFAEGCRMFVQEFDAWIGEIETASIRGARAGSDIPATPAALISAIQQRWSSRLDWLTALRAVAADPSQLVDAVFASYESTPSSASRRHLLDLFIRTATPVWSSLRSWLIDGMPLPSSFLDIDEINLSLDGDERPLDSELFIKRDRDVAWTDEDFWEAGYVADPETGWPTWMGETMAKVLEAGKARGLLKGLLGEPSQVDGWRPLSVIIAASSDGDAVLDIPVTIQDALDPLCQITIFQLRRVLDEECGLEQHLEAIEGMMFGRASDTADRFFAGLFSQIKEGRRWYDMQSLTAGLRDAIDQSGEYWLNPSALRISPGKQKIKDQTDVLAALGELHVSYTVPFPLSVLFTSNSLELRAKVFGFLCQVDYARRAVVEGWTVYGSADRSLRHCLAWFVNTLWTWINQRVIEVQSAAYQARLSQTSSLKEMIALEMDYARRMRDFCFLHDHTAELYDDVLAVLEIAIQASTASTPATDSRSGGQHPDLDDLSLSLAAAGVGAVRSPEALAVELHDRVMGISRAVEMLSAEGSATDEDEARRETWSMLSFVLEDWR